MGQFWLSMRAGVWGPVPQGHSSVCDGQAQPVQVRQEAAVTPSQPEHHHPVWSLEAMKVVLSLDLESCPPRSLEPSMVLVMTVV